ncbi:hypothetical protein J2Y58_001288 [Sphingomonas sp. BE138]|nr:hypothetical protein [Sphingomonas sp. BE138]
MMRYLMMSCAAGLTGMLATPTASAQASGNVAGSALPDLVVPTNGINLGSSSFYDGFSAARPGLTVLQYVRFNDLNAITDNKGDDAPAFRNPRINVTTSVTQLSVATSYTLGGNALGFDVLVPVTRIDSRFGSGGLQLRDNGTGLGDITFGPYIQFKPVMRGPRPVASVRLALNAIAPTGGFDRSRDLNQGSGYWSINPYVAWTLLPAPGWEVSGRTQYLYNFRTSRIANPPTIPGFTFRNGQAGQLIYTNLAASREISRGVALGANGFLVQQLDDDRINGTRLADTRRSAIYVGPGVHVDRLPRLAVNANVYLPVRTRNYATGPQINVQFIVPIH